MKGFIVLADNFEDSEAIVTIDILKRANIQLDLVAVNKKIIVSQYHNTLKVDYLLAEIDCQNYDFLIIPGGRAVEETLHHDKRLSLIIKHFFNNNKLIAAICAAPSLLGINGCLKNANYTCFPGYEKYIEEGHKSDENVVVNQNIITAKAMYYSIDFALAIIEKLQGTKKKNELLLQIKGQI